MKPPADPTKIRVVFNISNVRARDARLYQEVIASLGGEKLAGEVSLTRKQWVAIPDVVRNRLMDYLQTVNPNPDAHLKTEHPYDGCNECFRKQTAEIIERDRERREIETANGPGQARLNEYIRQGLLDNKHNGDIFWGFLDAKFPGIKVVTPQIVDAFIQAHRHELKWAPITAPPAPAPAPPEPELVLLSDGSLQKSLDEAPSSNWTVPQLRDWFKRQGGQQRLLRQQFGGSHRGSFFKADSQVV